MKRELPKEKSARIAQNVAIELQGNDQSSINGPVARHGVANQRGTLIFMSLLATMHRVCHTRRRSRESTFDNCQVWIVCRAKQAATCRVLISLLFAPVAIIDS